jgi:hypothetical protein
MPQPESLSDTPPSLAEIIDGLPSEEIDAGWNISISFGRLVQYTDEFAAALALFDFATEGMQRGPSNLPLREWRQMAGREGAMAIYQFGMTAEGLSATIGKYPTLATRFDQKTLGAARKLLERSFPLRELTRHAVAHAGEMFSDPKRAKEHFVVRSPGVSVAYRNVIQGRRVKFTICRTLCTYELSQKTLDRFIAVRGSYFSAFRKQLAERSP